MFDMRYHIASLVAVFLALSIGILVGTSIVNKGVLVQQQQKLVTSINESIEKLKKKNSIQNKQLKTADDFEETVFKIWAKNRLRGKNIAIFVFENDVDKRQETYAIQWLKQSGAKTATIKVDPEYYLFKDSDNVESIKRLYPRFPEQKLETSVISELFNELLKGRSTKMINELVENNALTIDDETIVPINGIVIIAGPSDELETDSVELSFASRAASMLPTAVVESAEILPSGLPMFIDKKISTIDNIDSGSGGVSVVIIMRGEKGNFGIKSQANKISPLSN